jgi:hypothetical protein
MTSLSPSSSQLLSTSQTSSNSPLQREEVSLYILIDWNLFFSIVSIGSLTHSLTIDLKVNLENAVDKYNQLLQNYDKITSQYTKLTEDFELFKKNTEIQITQLNDSLRVEVRVNTELIHNNSHLIKGNIHLSLFDLI